MTVPALEAAMTPQILRSDSAAVVAADALAAEGIVIATILQLERRLREHGAPGPCDPLGWQPRRRVIGPTLVRQRGEILRLEVAHQSGLLIHRLERTVIRHARREHVLEENH